MMKNVLVVISAVLLIVPVSVNFSYADSAEVLPKGISNIAIFSKFYFPIDEKYGPDGDTEDVAEDYNGILNSQLFPDLALVEAGFGMPPGSASLGESVVSFEYQFYIFETYYQYGITDRLTLGIMIPYWDVKNDVSAFVETSNATVGKTAIGASLGVPIAPLTGPFPDTVPLVTEDVQNLLGEGVDINGDGTMEIPGYGYKPIETWNGSGLSDIEVGFRYQYLKTEEWRLAFTGIVRLPTGEKDDPDNLMDYPLGTGTYTIIFHLNNDYVGFKNLLLNTTFRYEWVLPHDETLRVPANVNDPITDVKEKVDRDIGDWIELEASAHYEFTEGFSFSVLYEYGFALKTKVSGDRPDYFYDALEDETDAEEHVFIAGLNYSTLPKFMKKEFPIPLRFSLLYRDRFAGKNHSLKSRYIGLILMAFF